MALVRNQNRQLIADLALLLVAVIWGGTFPVIKTLVGEITPHYLVGVRFLLAFVVLGFIALPRIHLLDLRVLCSGVGVGFILWAAYAAQTIGLMYTSAAKGGFLTGLSVVIVPVLSAVWLKKYPSASAMAGVAVALAGLGLISLDFSAQYYLQYGDLWLVACAFLYAVQIVLVDKYVASTDALLLAWVEIGTVAVASLLYAAVTEPALTMFEVKTFLGILYLSILATALGQVIQFRAQRHTTPTRVGIILSMEPVFATIFAALFLHERVVPKTLAGCGLVLVGMLLVETKPLQLLRKSESVKDG